MKKYLTHPGLFTIISLLLLLPACSKTNGVDSTLAYEEGQQNAVPKLQDGYYWYNGVQISLEKNFRKMFILYKADDEESINASLIKNGLTADQSGKEYILSDIQYLEGITAPANLKWKIVEGADNLEHKKLSETVNASIIYEAPFFKSERGGELGLTNLFYVALKANNDFTRLKKLAEQYGVTILGNNRSMPLWYTLYCTKSSKFNALQMANTFYETGAFSVSQPDLMTVIKPASGQ